MASRLNELADQLWDFLVWFCLHRTTRYVAAWLLAVTVGGLVLEYAWRSFRHEHRSDGNHGHTTIDFGGQWLMGAMIAHGQGHNLYNRSAQRQVLRAGYPAEREAPEDKKKDDEKRGDAENLMSWFMGSDHEPAATTVGSFVAPIGTPDTLSAITLTAGGQQYWTPKRLAEASQRPVGGPLYPPIHAILFAPLGLLDPLDAYYLNQVLCIVWALGAAIGVRYLTRGKIWVPIAFVLIVLYPGFRGAIHLGQNPPLTLIILIWGWALLSRGKETAGGLVWGLLAFKPVWALAFFLVPLITRRWRFGLAMLGMGAGLALITLPFVGIQSWLDWLQVGQLATKTYNSDQNWIFLSRDLLGLPRRWMLNFAGHGLERGADRFEVALAGWVMILAVLEVTLMLFALRPQQARQTTGPAAACLLLAAWLTCYHFMYYDVLLSALPLFVLLADPKKLIEPTYLALTTVPGELMGREVNEFYRPLPADELPPPPPILYVGYQHFWVFNKFELNILFLLLAFEHGAHNLGLGLSVSGVVPQQALVINTIMDGYHLPWDTFLLLALWLWCGWRWLKIPGDVPSLRQERPTDRSGIEAGGSSPDLDAAIVGSEEVQPGLSRTTPE